MRSFLDAARLALLASGLAIASGAIAYAAEDPKDEQVKATLGEAEKKADAQKNEQVNAPAGSGGSKEEQVKETLGNDNGKK